jgi:hypothetical protein
MLVTRSLLARALLTVFAIFSALGACAYATAGESAPVLLGNRAVGSHHGHLRAGQAEAFRLRTRTSGVADVVHVYIGSGSTARAVAAGVYSNVGGAPGALLGSGSGPSSKVHAWSTVSITPTRLASGATYWLAVLGEGGALRYRSHRRDPCFSSLSVQRHLRELPVYWRAGGMRARSNCPISAYLATAGPALAPRTLLPTPAIASVPSSGATASPPTSPASGASSTPEEPASPPRESSPPLAPPKDVVAPTIKGSAVVGGVLSASSGTWTGSSTPYTYQWEDCDALGVGCLSVGGATTPSYKIPASDHESTLRVVVSASNAGGTTSVTSEKTAVVAAEASSPTAPKNTASPVVSGSGVENQTLSATAGTWSGSPTSYAFQWQDCNSSSKECSAIGGATKNTRVLTSSDVGHTLRVVVKATNAGGTGEAISATTSVVTAAEKSKTGTPSGCFEDPESEGTSRFEACGYPGPKNTGVVENGGETECSSLPAWNKSTEPLSAGATIEGKEFKIDTAAKSGGGISIGADKVRLNKDCFLIKGECSCLQEGPAIALGGGFTLTVENSTFRSPSTTESVEKDIWFNSAGSDIVAKNDRFEDCGECLNGLGTVEVTDSYMDASQWEGHEPENNELHRENIYMMQGTATVENSTMFVPDDEVAEIFDEDNGIACDTHVTFENNLLAGSGGMFQLCGHSNGQTGTGTTIIDHNRVARCLTTPITEPSDGIPNCSGPYVEGADSHGFMPHGGSSQILGNGEANPYGATKEFEGNYWDDSLKTITVKEAEE